MESGSLPSSAHPPGPLAPPSCGPILPLESRRRVVFDFAWHLKNRALRWGINISVLYFEHILPADCSWVEQNAGEAELLRNRREAAQRAGSRGHFLNSLSFARGMKKLSQPSEEAIIVRSRATSCEAHFAPFKNLMKAKQRTRRERALARADARRFGIKRLSKEAARGGNGREHRDDVSIPWESAFKKARG